MESVQTQVLAIDALSETDQSLWREAMGSAERTSVFHSLEWNRLLWEEFGVATRAVVALVDGEGVGLFPFHQTKNWKVFPECSSPLGGFDSPYGGPVVRTGYEGAVEVLVHATQAFCRATACRIITVPLFPEEPLRQAGFVCQEAYTALVQLGRTEEELWAGIHSKTRNMIRKAEKKEVVIAEAGEAEIALYYPMLVETLERSGTAPLPQSFFQRVLRELPPRNMARFTLASHQGRAIAGLIALCFREGVYYWRFKMDRHRTPVHKLRKETLARP